MTIRASDIVAALRRHLPPERWAFFPELIVRDGMAREERRLDVWACSVWPSDNYARACYEVKVSRGDWLQEVKHPAKRRLGVLLSNEFWVATPEGLVRPEEMPPEAGLIEVNQAGRCQVARQAPWRETLPPTWALLATVARRTQREEQKPMAEVAEMALHEAVYVTVGALLNETEDELRSIAGRPRGAGRSPEAAESHHAAIQRVRGRLEQAALDYGVNWIRRNGIFSK